MTLSPSRVTPASPFAELQLDRMSECRDDADWLDARASAPGARYLWLDADGRLAVTAGGGRPYWLDRTQRQQGFAELPASLLGVAGEHTYFLLHDAQRQISADANVGWLGLREAGLCLDAFAAGLFAYARGLAQWQASMRFCPVCGASLIYASAGHRAACSNRTCGALQFPRTDAAVIAIVEHEGACLLGRQAGWPAGRYSTLAGFVEPGETLEAAVRREVAEEAGVVVGACQYHSSQPWPFPASLMVGFTATALGRTINLRDGELEDARWFTPADLVAGIRDGSLLPSSPVSVAWRLLADWLAAHADIDLAELQGARA